jgi:hypothetical protein
MPFVDRDGTRIPDYSLRWAIRTSIFVLYANLDQVRSSLLKQKGEPESGDPAIAAHYQIWLFVYNSGNPIVLSAMRLRQSLQAVRKGVDPEGKDPALNQMVVIGHSQGGLLTKMMVVDSGNRFWNNVTSVPFD